MDGVIVDNHEWHFKAWVEFGRRHGIGITEKEFRKYFGSTNQLVLQSLFGNELTEKEMEEFAEEKEAVYRDLYRPYITAVKGLPSYLRLVYDQGFTIALATSAPMANVKFTLAATGLEKYFSIITDSAMVSRGKPDPQVYLLTADKLGVKPAECIVFEDSVPGILSAQKAGMQVIGVATTHNYDELLMYVNKIIMNFEAGEKLPGRDAYLQKST